VTAAQLADEACLPGEDGPVGAPSRPVVTTARPDLGHALDELPDRQRTVVELREVHGLTSEEVCERLQITAGNQRIRLHRGRARVRARLEEVYRGRGGPGDDRA
jgi:RNA polymerase sigma-70 factor (ECF subfamily)